MGLELIFAIVAFVSAAASTAYQVIQAKKMKQQAAAAADARKGFEIVVEGSPDWLPIAYGRALLGGVRTWAETTSTFRAVANNADQVFMTGSGGQAGYSYNYTKYEKEYMAGEAFDAFFKGNRTATAGAQAAGYMNTSINGDRNEFLCYQQAMCVGPIKGIKDVIIDGGRYLDDPLLGTYGKIEGPTSKKSYNGVKAALRLDFHYNGGVADALAAANFSVRANALFDGIAYLSAWFKIDRDEPQFSGIPPVQVLAEGRLVRWVTGGELSTVLNYEDDPANYRYDNSGPLCLLDYMLDKENGGGYELDEIDFDSFEACDAIARTIVQNNVVVGGKFWKPTTGAHITTRNLPLYECNMLVDTKKPVRDNLESLLSTMGDARLVWSNGKYSLSMQYPANNAAISLATEITDSDLVLGEEIGIKFPDAEARYNFATVRFHNEFENFTEDSVSWPPKYSNEYQRGIGAQNYPTGVGSWNDAKPGGRLLNECAVWNGSADVTNMTWKLNIDTAAAGTYTIDGIGDDYFSFEIRNSVNAVVASLVDAGGNLNENDVKTTSVTLAAGVYTINVTGNNNTTEKVEKKGVAVKIYSASKTLWTTRSTSYSSFVTVTESDVVYNAMLAEDNGAELEASLFADGITDPYHALAKAEELVRSSRIATGYNFKQVIIDRYLQPGDFIKFRSVEANIGVDTPLYLRVESVKLDADDDKGEICDVTATRFDASMLAWNVKDDVFISPNNTYKIPVPQVYELAYIASVDYQAETSGRLLAAPVSFAQLGGYIYYMHRPEVDPLDIDGRPLFVEIGRSPEAFFDLPPISASSAFFGVRAMSTGGAVSELTLISHTDATELSHNWLRDVRIISGVDTFIQQSAGVYLNDTITLIGLALNFTTPVYQWTIGATVVSTSASYVMNAFNDVASKRVSLRVSESADPTGKTSITDKVIYSVNANSPGADVTAANIAAGITNQSLWATYATYTPTEVVGNVNSAIALANDAIADAAAANGVLADIASDSVLSPSEKDYPIVQTQEFIDQYAYLQASSTDLGITTEFTDFNNAYAALVSYLSGLTTPVAWNNKSGNTTIVGSTFRSKFTDVLLKRAILSKVISTKASERATWSQTSGRPPLLTGEGVTVDEYLRDPSVWSYAFGTFTTEPANGEGLFSITPSVSASSVISNIFTNAAPIDKNATYNVSIDAFESGSGAGLATFFLGVQLFDSAGNNITGDGSLWHYFLVGTALPEKGYWHTFSSRIGKGTSKPFPANAARFSLAAYPNYNGASSVCYLRRMRARRITDQSFTATTPNAWTLGDGVAIENTSVTGGWGNGAYSKAAIKGPQRISWRWAGGDAAKMVGLGEGTPTIYTACDYNLYADDAAGSIQVYYGGSPSTTYTGITDRNEAEFAIEYDGLYLRGYKNGVALGNARFVGPDKSYRVCVDSYSGGTASGFGNGASDLKHQSTLSLSLVGNNTFDSSGNAWIAANGATNDATFTVSGTGMEVAGNTIRRNVTGGWDAQAYTAYGFSGGAFCSFSPSLVSAYMSAGFSTNPTNNASFANMEFAFIMEGSGTIQAAESSSVVAALGTWSAGCVLSLVYDNEYVRYLINGSEKRAVKVGPNRKYHFDSSFVNDVPITGVRFGPVTANSSPINWNHTGFQSSQGNTVFNRDEASLSWAGKSISEQASRGSASVSAKMDVVNTFFGLHQLGASGSSYESMKWAFHRSGNGRWYVWSLGSSIHDLLGTGYNGVTFTDNTQFRIDYDGSKVRWYADGVLMHEQSDGVSPNISYQAGVALFEPNGRVTNIQFGPFSDQTWLNIDGTDKPENYSNRGANKVFNGDVNSGLRGWSKTYYQLLNFELSAEAEAIGGQASFALRKTTTGVGQAVAVSKAIPVIPGQRLFARIKYYGSDATGNGIYFRIAEYSGKPEPLYVDALDAAGAVTGSVAGVGSTDIIADGPVALGITAVEKAYIVPSGIYWVSVMVLNWTGGPAKLIYDDVYLGENEAGADITSAISGSGSIDIPCDTGGIPSPVLSSSPKNTFYTLTRNGVDVTADATWSLTVLTGTLTASFPTNGQLRITGVGASTSRVRLTASYSGITRNFELDVIKRPAAASTGGGAGGGTSATTTVSFDSSSTSMSVASTELVFNTGSAGTATMSGNIIAFGDEASPQGTFTSYWIWQRWNGSSWVDVGTETIAGPSLVIGRYYDTDVGTWVYVTDSVGEMNLAAVITGLTANAETKFRLRIRCGQTTKLMNFYTPATIGGVGS